MANVLGTMKQQLMAEGEEYLISDMPIFHGFRNVHFKLQVYAIVCIKLTPGLYKVELAYLSVKVLS